MRAIKWIAILFSVALPATALAGRGGSNAAIQEAIASGSPDAIIAEVERAEVLACVSCLDTVLPLVDHPDARVRDVAGWWIAKRGIRDQARDMAYVRLTGSDATLARNAAQLLGRFRLPEAVPALSTYLARPLDGASGAQAAAALGEIGHASGVPALQAALASPLPEVRAASAKALRQVRGYTDVAPLTALLADGDESVRTQAVFTIGTIGAKTMVQPLSMVLASDGSAAVRKHAAWALGQIGDLSAVPALTAAKSDPDPLVASMAAASLARMR